MNEWQGREYAEAYLGRLTEIPHRAEGEATLLSELPETCRRVLDLGCGDGHLLALVASHCDFEEGVAVDFSRPMLQAARQRFGNEDRVSLLEHDLGNPLPEMGTFDCVVSSFAIHHCEDDRKRQLYAEIFDRLEPGGVFCNLEHVASPNKKVHGRFLDAMGMGPGEGDPSNRLLDVETQLTWMRDIGMQDVDCFWKWRELALMVGRRPVSESGAKSEPAAAHDLGPADAHVGGGRVVEVKQVICVRHDLKMRRGKQIAQACHASMSFLTRRLQRRGTIVEHDLSEAERLWLSEGFAKVCCRVDSEEELLEIYGRAQESGLAVHMITDSGKTEFHGRPTRTCLAIGPDDVAKIDEITGKLKLL